MSFIPHSVGDPCPLGQVRWYKVQDRMRKEAGAGDPEEVGSRDL